jgi:hypothetical protein
MSVICLENPKMTRGSTTENDEAKTMLTLVCEFTVTGSALLG